ncbi:MAG TPA: thioredoxin domain-containing protein [Nitrosopumilaceae archaeon]|nr:thioredoxin domain-containing protein [Nitrosopumilaceae archaeon]
MNLHGPSLVIGSGITAVVIFITFFAFGNTSNEKELILEQAENIQPNPEKIGLDVFTENGSPPHGDPNAPITLIEFGDYQCHFCNVYFHNTEPSILANYVETGKVKIIFKDFTIIGPDSVTAAHAAHCADDQGKFWEYHDILYNNWTGENNGWASSENLLSFAQQIELNIDEFTECMLNETHTNIITQSNSDAKTLGLTGTPSFFVIGKDNVVTKIHGAQPYENFKRIFDSELKK